MSAKWCSQCGALNPVAGKKCLNSKCSCVFTGEELGSNLEPVMIDTETRRLGEETIKSRLLALSEGPSENVVSRKEDLRVCLIRIAWSLLVAVIGAVFIALAVGLSVPLLLIVGGAASIVALVMFVASVWWFLRVPKFTTPKQVADCFYGELGGLGTPLGGGSVSRAWSCLDAKARTDFNSPEDFKKYWVARQNDMKQWALDRTKELRARRRGGRTGEPYCAINVKSTQVSNTTDRVADLQGEIMVSVFESVEARKDIAGNPIFETVCYGRFVWPQSKTLLMGHDRWYLTSGTLDGPKS